MLVEEAGVARGEVEEDDRYSGATVVLSEGGTEVLKEGEEKGEAGKLDEEEEVIQPVGSKEVEIEQAAGTRGQEIDPVVEPKEMEIEQDVGHREEVILIDDEVVEEGQPTEIVSQRTGQLKEVLATSGWMAMKNVGSDAEEEEDEGNLLRRPRSRRRASTEVATAPEERQTVETMPLTGETPVHDERQREMPAGEEETKEERLKR